LTISLDAIRQGVLLKTKESKVPGELVLFKSRLQFLPDNAEQASSSATVENASVTGMQVSKAGATRPILKVLCQDGNYSFDFSQARPDLCRNC
jgi:hypothetical protein